MEDDIILMDWVTEHERKGARILGNEIYKDLAQIVSLRSFDASSERKLMMHEIEFTSHISVVARSMDQKLESAAAAGLVFDTPIDDTTVR